MFTWICPKCGNEVPPSRDECPRCSPVTPPSPPAAVPSEPVVTQPPVPPALPPSLPQPAPASVPVAAPAPQPSAPVFTPAASVYQQPPPEPKSTALRDLGITLLVALVLLGGGYYAWNRMEKADAVGTGESKSPLETPAGSAAAHPMAKQLELTGFRIREPKPGQLEVKMLLVNHSPADMANLSIGVVLSAKGTNKEVASFPAKVKNLGPYGSTEISATVKTNMRAYELPDWQFLEARLTVSPE